MVELTRLPLETIDARAGELSRASASDGAVVEPWMAWLSSYHALLRAALWIKPRVRRGELLDDARAAKLAGDASAHAGVEVDASFARAMVDPRSARLVAVVLARLERDYSEPGAEIKRALFPRVERDPGKSAGRL